VWKKNSRKEGFDGAGPSAVAWLGALSTAQLLGIIGGVVVLVLLAGQWGFLVHLQYRFRIVSYSSGHENSNLRTLTFGKGA
jgi:hypothetical protein